MNDIRIISVGDIMPGGVLNKSSQPFVSKDILDLFQSAELRIGNLECAIGNEPTYSIQKMQGEKDVIYAEDIDLQRLKILGIDVVSLANNHFYDLGFEGALHTIKLLQQHGIKHCGAGLNLIEASQPAEFEIHGRKIGILSFCDYRKSNVGFVPIATSTSPGVNPMYDDYVISEIKKYRNKFDIIIVIPHWGKENTTWPTYDVYKLVKKMETAGANLILGGHTHCVQTVINNKKCNVALSLGNFLFPDRIIIRPRSTWYPKKQIDLTSLPQTYSYPFVTQPTLKIWKRTARIGMILISTINHKNNITSRYELSELTKENYLTYTSDFHNSRARYIFKITPILFRWHLYPCVWPLVLLCRKAKYFIKSRFSA